MSVNERTNIKIVVDFAEAVPANTICYAVLIGQKNFTYDPKNEKVVEEF